MECNSHIATPISDDVSDIKKGFILKNRNETHGNNIVDNSVLTYYFYFLY